MRPVDGPGLCRLRPGFDDSVDTARVLRSYSGVTSWSQE
ncbi:hypothetical protein BH23ACT7_BH23ACT7_05100 [soil metagenome]